ncbi:MAG: FAD-dependent monooxygenase, partial [Phycisphaerae bacterium]|nr:FAD-dependent monooxygenase [Phycisphaerae bacterium]
MHLNPLRVAIVGSGTAGPAAGIFLSRAGHHVTLFERAPERLPVGAGFLLQPTGWSVLERLGLAGAVAPHVARIHRLYCRTRTGRTLLNLPYAELGAEVTGAGTHRATLLNVLLDAAESAGTALRWGVEIRRLSCDASGRRLLHDADRRTHGPFDLLLICDGAQSVLREQCGVRARVTRYPWGALWFIGKRTPEFDPHVLWQCVDSTRRLLGFLPTGTRD